MKLISTQQQVDDYFNDLLIEALKSHRLDIANGSRVYLVQLFEEFACADKFHEAAHVSEAGPPTLAWLYERASHVDSSEQFDAWRHLGDVALIVAGLFGAYVERKRSLVGIDYYIEMGTSAYETAAGCAKATGLVPIFRELSHYFRELVDVLTNMGEAANLPVAKSIERLYERWLSNTGQDQLHRRLTKLGASPLILGYAKA